MEWPSERIPQGGVFHPPKVNYSPETKKFLNLLMEETKMTTIQRNKLNYFLRNGEPLPSPNSAGSINSKRKPKILIRPGSSKRRTREDIVKSGAYEREKFVPEHPKVDREEQKKRLQDILANGKDTDPKKVPQKSKPKNNRKVEESEINRFDELVKEIRDREEWLEEMEQLGEGKKYKQIIEQQIQERIREMQKLKLTEEDKKTR